jgi:hypothetical protein
MRVLYKGLIIAGIQVLLVGSLGAKLLIDRATLPRVWVQVAPFDPLLPIRGRYLRLKIVGPAHVGNVSVPANEPIAFFISEHTPDPSRLKAGEELWAEVTVPKQGPPRPIRLGVKRNGILTPLPAN